MDNEENIRTGADNSTQGTPDSQQEKTFTQEEVNKIIQQRLQRERENSDKNKSAELEQKELRLSAWEKLNDVGLSKKYLDVVNCTNSESIDKSIETLQELVKEAQQSAGNPKKGTYKVYTTVSETSNGHSGSLYTGADDIRAAMKLK